MKTLLFVLSLLALPILQAQARECTAGERYRGCQTVTVRHCYPRSGDCWERTICRCPISELADVSELLTETFAEDGFSGVRCGPIHQKTGEKTCCVYRDGVVVSCSTQSTN